jgi:hypothetical protein
MQSNLKCFFNQLAMAHLSWHLVSVAVIYIITVILMPTIGLLPLGLMLLANLIDIDHLIKFGKIETALRRYGSCTHYSFHKIWLILPIIGIAIMTPFFWLGIGLLVHFILDFIENQILFKDKFEWI